MLKRSSQTICWKIWSMKSAVHDFKRQCKSMQMQYYNCKLNWPLLFSSCSRCCPLRKWLACLVRCPSQFVIDSILSQKKHEEEEEAFELEIFLAVGTRILIRWRRINLMGDRPNYLGSKDWSRTTIYLHFISPKFQDYSASIDRMPWKYTSDLFFLRGSTLANNY